MAELAKRMAELSADGRHAVLCGDWNVAHTEHDIKAWKANVKKSGFLPSERQWLTELMNPAGWTSSGACTPTALALQLVVVAWQGLRQRRRLADRPSPGHRIPGHPRPLCARGEARGFMRCAGPTTRR